VLPSTLTGVAVTFSSHQLFHTNVKRKYFLGNAFALWYNNSVDIFQTERNEKTVCKARRTVNAGFFVSGVGFKTKEQGARTHVRNPRDVF
jgi:hypothetical protein